MTYKIKQFNNIFLNIKNKILYENMYNDLMTSNLNMIELFLVDFHIILIFQ